MTEFVIIEKKGSIKEVKVKSVSEDELYKKAGFKSNTHFKLQTEWDVEIKSKKYNVCLYGKTEGRAGQENKYDFPPPVDNTLFFGNCLLINRKNKKFVSLSSEEWKQIYNHLFKGFEDIEKKILMMKKKTKMKIFLRQNLVMQKMDLLSKTKMKMMMKTKKMKMMMKMKKS